MERSISAVEWSTILERKKEVGVGDTEVGVEITHTFHVHSKSFHPHSKSDCWISCPLHNCTAPLHFFWRLIGFHTTAEIRPGFSPPLG